MCLMFIFQLQGQLAGSQCVTEERNKKLSRMRSCYSCSLGLVSSKHYFCSLAGRIAYASCIFFFSFSPCCQQNAFIYFLAVFCRRGEFIMRNFCLIQSKCRPFQINITVLKQCIYKQSESYLTICTFFYRNSISLKRQ